MRHSSQGLRIALLAGASFVALAAAAPSAGAADLSKAPPLLVLKERWSWWIEGGAFNAGSGNSDDFSLGPRETNIRPQWGWEGAVGFDWSPQGWGPYHLSGQFRYGSAQKTKTFAGSTTIVVPPPAGTTLIFLASNNEKIRDDHWLVDFAVGRDFGLGNFGNGIAQWKFGVRVADLRTRLTASGPFASTPAIPIQNFSAQQDATFVGAGPRLGVEGSTQLGAGFAYEWLAGAAVLVGERHTSQLQTAPIFIGAGTITVTSGQAISETAAVFNVDGQAGLSYSF